MRRTLLTIAVALAMSGAWFSVAAAQEAAGKPGTTMAAGQAGQSGQAAPPSLDVSGSFSAAFRWRDVNGNPDKYREDINLRTGPRLANLDLNVNPTGFGFFDLLNVRASDLGDDPFQTLEVTLKKFSTYEFRYRRFDAEYFYHDTLRPQSDVTISLENGGDYHTFNFKRVNDSFDFLAHITPRFKAFTRMDRFSRVGPSTTTFDIARDLFEFDVPLNQHKYDFTAGVEYTEDKVSVSFDETYRDWKTDGHVFLPGASPGENTTDVSELSVFDFLAPYSFTMPQSTVRVHARPDPRLNVTGMLSYAKMSADYAFDETIDGVNFNGAPLSTFRSGGGHDMKRSTTIGDIDVTYDANDRVTVLGNLRFSRLDQTGELFDSSAPTVDTSLNVSTNQGDVGARFFPTPRTSITAGLRFEHRTATFEFQEDEPEAPPSTNRTTFFVTGVYEPVRAVNLLGEYERGNYDNPFTRISPTALDRAKFRVRYHPTPAVSVNATLLVRRINNDVSNADVNLTNFTLGAAYDRQPLSLSASYSRRDVKNDVTSTVAPFNSVFQLLYESSVDMLTGGVAYQAHKSVRPGFETVVYRNDGTFGLTWQEYRAFVEFTAPRGYLVRFYYRHNTYNEKSFNFDDYSANIVDVSVGYRF